MSWFGSCFPWVCSPTAARSSREGLGCCGGDPKNEAPGEDEDGCVTPSSSQETRSTQLTAEDKCQGGASGGVADFNKESDFWTRGAACNVLLNSEWDLEEDIEECGVKENMQVLDRVGFASEASVSTCASLDLERWQHFAPLLLLELSPYLDVKSFAPVRGSCFKASMAPSFRALLRLEQPHFLQRALHRRAYVPGVADYDPAVCSSEQLLQDQVWLRKLNILHISCCTYRYKETRSRWDGWFEYMLSPFQL
eukprot:s1315_g8.t1